MTATDIPPDLRYTTEHEWASISDDGIVTVGITDYAQDALGDVVYVETSAVGEAVEEGGTFGEVQSPKAVSDLYAPVAGEVVEVNAALEDAPELVNSDPYGEGWLIRIRATDISKLDGLLNADDYAAHLTTLEE